MSSFVLIRTAIIASLGGLMFGYNVLIIGAVIADLSYTFHFDDVHQGLIVAMLPLGSGIGLMFVGYLSDTFGRWRTMQLQNLLFIISGFTLSLAQNVGTLYFGRIICGEFLE